MSSVFAGALAQAMEGRALAGRRWVYVPYDQLTDAVGPLSTSEPEALGIVMVENPQKAGRRPYHKQKLAMVLANGRHFALEQARRGVAVRHVVAEGSYAEALRPIAAELGPLMMMEAAERELWMDLKPLVDDGFLEVVPHEGWLTTTKDFDPKAKGGPYRMDAFYRRVRKRTGLLLDEGGKPLGGKWSHDADNREFWPGDPPAPALPRFDPDPITQEVGELIRRHYEHHPGVLDLSALPATAEDARTQWAWAQAQCMVNFGPYEDAMSLHSRTLFHTRVSALVNLHRLLPAQVVHDVAEAEIPLSSKEGFIRQVLGWREFVRHVHRATDGFRSLAPAADVPGDAGYERWSGWPWAGTHAGGDGGSTVSYLGAQAPIPPALWGERSGMACLDDVVKTVWEEGYSHHITRLMVLANLGSLLDLSPRALTDWFWVAYTDAYDWVVEPNVLGMGTFATGPLMTTKPYVSGAAYIDKMSDYCSGCGFHPKKTCPITRLYWAYLERHQDKLSDNHRLSLIMGSLRKRSPENKAKDAATFESVRGALLAGELVPPSR
ncbi:MAG: cryptochrome/photolyase family protein [Myxococcota bacterium]